MLLKNTLKNKPKQLNTNILNYGPIYDMGYSQAKALFFGDVGR
jgi:hypothetical protein